MQLNLVDKEKQVHRQYSPPPPRSAVKEGSGSEDLKAQWLSWQWKEVSQIDLASDSSERPTSCVSVGAVGSEHNGQDNDNTSGIAVQRGPKITRYLAGTHLYALRVGREGSDVDRHVALVVLVVDVILVAVLQCNV